MVAILRPFSVDVEDLVDLSRLPSVDDLRPCACPLCGEPSQRPGERLGIVGHGTYLRQVLEASKAIVIRVRRYLCRACRRTISVLPEALLPRRWYAAGAILLALVLSLLLGKTAEEIRRRFAAPGETRGWKTLDPPRVRDAVESSPIWARTRNRRRRFPAARVSSACCAARLQAPVCPGIR
jgi:hypothetical protein